MPYSDYILSGRYNKFFKCPLNDFFIYHYKLNPHEITTIGTTFGLRSEYRVHCSDNPTPKATWYAHWDIVKKVITSRVGGCGMEFFNDESSQHFICADSRVLRRNPFHVTYNTCGGGNVTEPVFDDFFPILLNLSPYCKLRYPQTISYFSNDAPDQIIVKETLRTRSKAITKSEEDEIKRKETLEYEAGNICYSIQNIKTGSRTDAVFTKIQLNALPGVNISDPAFCSIERVGLMYIRGNGFGLPTLRFADLAEAPDNAGEEYSSRLFRLIDFYTGVIPLGAVGDTLLRRMDYKDENIFTYKHRFISRALNDYNLVDLLYCMGNNEWCCIDYRHPVRLNIEQMLCYPLQIRNNIDDGRQYVVYFEPTEKVLCSLRIDYIESVCPVSKIRLDFNVVLLDTINAVMNTKERAVASKIEGSSEPARKSEKIMSSEELCQTICQVDISQANAFLNMLCLADVNTTTTGVDAVSLTDVLKSLCDKIRSDKVVYNLTSSGKESIALQQDEQQSKDCFVLRSNSRMKSYLNSALKGINNASLLNRSVSVEELSDKYSSILKNARKRLEHCWGTSIYVSESELSASPKDEPKYENVSVVFKFNLKNEEHSLRRLEESRRFGNVYLCENGECLFKAKVVDSIEMVKLIQSFWGKVDFDSIKPKALRERIESNFVAAHNLYINGEETGRRPGFPPTPPRRIPKELHCTDEKKYHEKLFNEFMNDKIERMVRDNDLCGANSAFALRYGYNLPESSEFFRSVMPLMTIQKRWLLTVLGEPLSRLFLSEDEATHLRKLLCADDTKPLYSSKNDLFVEFGARNRNKDIELMAKNFSCLTKQMLACKPVKIEYHSQKYVYTGKPEYYRVVPVRYEYSDRDKSMRVWCWNGQTDQYHLFNLERMACVEKVENPASQPTFTREEKLAELSEYISGELNCCMVTVIFDDRQNIPDRLLNEFSPYWKHCVKDRSTGMYTMQMKYDRAEYVDIAVRLMSYGAGVKVQPQDSQKDANVYEQIIDRLKKQAHFTLPV